MNKPSIVIWRPATTYIVIISAIVVLISLVAAYMLENFKPTVPVTIGAYQFHLQVADTDEKLKKGLSGVRSLGVNGGLLMKFDTDDHWGIWMKDMNVSIDIVWLNKNKEVVYIVKNAAPELSTDTVFKPKLKARYVLELPTGSVDKAAIKTGTGVVFDDYATGELWQ